MDQIVKDLFWDSNSVDYEKNSATIIERALEFGNPEQIRAVFKHYHRAQVEEVLQKSRRLTPKSANFWADYFDLPKKYILCLKEQSKKTQKSSWPY